MGITETPTSTTTKLSLETFRDVFKQIEPEVEIDAFEIEQGSGRGDNYTATLYRIHLTGQRIVSSLDKKKQKWEKSLICKRLPDNAERREAYKSDNLFRNEVVFYTIILPELINFQATKVEYMFSAIPKCYIAKPDLVILEDLCTRGFQMTDRKKGLSVAETQMVLKQVAQFHALSLSYKFEHPIQFEKLRHLVTECLFCTSNEGWYKNYYERLTKNAIRMISDVLPEDSKYLTVFKNFAETNSFFSQMVTLVSTESPLSAICHGDCWINNFLYRFDSNSSTEAGTEDVVLEVALVDFQLIRYSSIALDIANLLFCCTNKSTRDEHLSSFIQFYTSEVFRWLQLLCTQLPEYCETLDKFEKLFAKELKTYGRFALGLALDIIPISTCSSEDAPDLYINRNDETLRVGAPILNFPPNDLCRQKLSEILIDMVDREML